MVTSNINLPGTLPSRFRLWSNQLLAGSRPMLAHSTQKTPRRVFSCVGPFDWTGFVLLRRPCAHRPRATAILPSRFRLWSNQLLAGSCPMLAHSTQKTPRRVFSCVGRIDWTRTSDLFVPNEAFYQAELQSEVLLSFTTKIFLCNNYF